MKVLVGLIPADMMGGMPYLNALGLNVRVLGFAFAVGASAAVLFSLTPAFRLSTLDVREGMAEGGRGSAGKVWTRIGSKLVVLELTTAMVLLVGAGLLSKSFYRLLQIDTGFEPQNLITMRVSAPRNYWEDKEAVALGRKGRRGDQDSTRHNIRCAGSYDAPEFQRHDGLDQICRPRLQWRTQRSK
jgi:hypothetical protein